MINDSQSAGFVKHRFSSFSLPSSHTPELFTYLLEGEKATRVTTCLQEVVLEECNIILDDRRAGRGWLNTSPEVTPSSIPIL